jgi:hypothetical protein
VEGVPAPEQLRLALELVAYELARHPSEHRPADAIAALDEVRSAAARLPPSGTPLRATYEPLLELATAAVVALGELPEPDEVDGLTALAGFAEWREQRRAAGG